MTRRLGELGGLETEGAEEEVKMKQRRLIKVAENSFKNISK